LLPWKHFFLSSYKNYPEEDYLLTSFKTQLNKFRLFAFYEKKRTIDLKFHVVGLWKGGGEKSMEQNEIVTNFFKNQNSQGYKIFGKDGFGIWCLF
jgi:hypothetical protein